jgi:hypothetical protein
MVPLQSTSVFFDATVVVCLAVVPHVQLHGFEVVFTWRFTLSDSESEASRMALIVLFFGLKPVYLAMNSSSVK